MPFSFLNAAILTGIAAGALPILIHLFSRRKVKKVPFSSLRFLEQISRRRVKKIRLTQWIILALRVLMIALLAFALSRPAFQGDFSLGKTRSDSAVAIVLDRSFSMGAEGRSQPMWDSAKARVEEVLEALENQDRVWLIGADPLVEENESFPEPLAAKDALRALDIGFGTTDLPTGVRRAAATLDEATALNKELFVISDFQKSGFQGAEIGVTDLGVDLDPSIRVFLVPMGEGPIANTAIEEARAEGTSLEQRVRVLMARHGETPVDDIALTVESTNEVLGETPASVQGNSRQAAEVVLTRLPAEGEMITARISGDRLAIDDVRYVPSIGAGRLPALLVQDPAQPSPFLPLALSPAKDIGRFDLQRMAPQNLGSTNFSDYKLLVLDNVTFLPRETLIRLRQWREAGGLLFISLGDRVDLRFYNEDLLPALFPGVKLGNLLGTPEATGESYSLTPRAPGHRIFAGFQAKVGEPLTGASFWRVVEVQIEEPISTLAEFGPGLPALIEGDGAVLFASSLDSRWNDFPTHGAFLPLVHQSVEGMLQERGGGEVRVGEVVEGVVDRRQVPPRSELVCLGPDGLELNVTSSQVSRGLRLVSEATEVPGFYHMKAGDKVLFSRAVNIDPSESNLATVSNLELKQMFPNERSTVIEAGVPIGTTVREARYGREFWKEIVAFVLLLALIEAWLARRGVA